MLAVLLALTLRQNMTLEEWEQWVKPDCEIPFFCMLWAPWCHYCRDIHPTWIALQEEYKDDANIMLGAVDCVAYKVCEYNHVHAFPTFLEHYRGDFTNTTDENKTVEIFQYIADRLLEKKTRDPFHQYTGEIDHFPSFVFHIPTMLNYSIIHVVKRAIAATGISLPFFIDQHESNPSIPKIVAHLGPDQTVEYTQPPSLPTLQAFLTQNANVFDYSWTINSLRNQKWAVFVTNDAKIVMLIKKFATKLPGTFSWGRTEFKKELRHYFGVRQADLPVVLIVDGATRQFALLRGAHDPRAIENFFKAPAQFSPIPPPPRTLPLWLKLTATLIGALVLAGSLIWLVFRRSTAKQE
jgi:thiol-disulfide isomerase/thioredoxin